MSKFKYKSERMFSGFKNKTITVIYNINGKEQEIDQ